MSLRDWDFSLANDHVNQGNPPFFAQIKNYLSHGLKALSCHPVQTDFEVGQLTFWLFT